MNKPIMESEDELRRVQNIIEQDRINAVTEWRVQKDRADKYGEIIDYMRNRYSPVGGRGCELCVFENGKFVRPCKLHVEIDKLEAADRDIEMCRALLNVPSDDEIYSSVEELTDRAVFLREELEISQAKCAEMREALMKFKRYSMASLPNATSYASFTQAETWQIEADVAMHEAFSTDCGKGWVRKSDVANKLTAALDSTSPLKDSVQRLRNELEAE